MAELILKNISKTYGDVVAIDNFQLDIKDGEFVTLVGPSGCGKSTLLRMIAGLETITQGEMYLDNQCINDVEPKNRNIAMVFQNYALYPHMTVFQNMAFGLKMRKVSQILIEERVQKAAKILGLTELLQRKSKALSGGQQQRVAVGRAIVREPKLFLFDEPLSNLDAKLRVSMRAELIKLHKHLNATMIYVTHDQVEAMSMGERLVVLKDGRIQQVGEPLQVYHNPANLFVAGFIGSPPMNFIPCNFEVAGDELILTNNGLRLVLSPAQKEAVLRHNHLPPEVILGLRPEDIMEPEYLPEAELAQTIKIYVEFIEPMGSEVLATCRLGENNVIARLSPKTSIRSDETANLGIAVQGVKLFHPQTGEALL